MISELKKRGRAAVTSRLDLEPVRILWTQGTVKDAENLLIKRERQISLMPAKPAVMETGDVNAAILLDFGCELHGGIRILAWQESLGHGIRVRIRFGESASEAMSEPWQDTNATNDHARRDLVAEIGMMSMNPIGETGFRFVRIDLLDRGTLTLKSVLAQLVYKDIPYRGSFRCSDELLNRIWMTGAYTQHLNTQEFVWDGVKRDRLVWIADIHPEMLTIRTVFGEDDSVRNSLDFIRKETPLPGWMNRIASYSMWYVIIVYDWYLYTGDPDLICEQEEYLMGLGSQLQGLLGEDGKYKLDRYECFVDWPSCDRPDVVDAGMKAIHYMALDRLERLFVILRKYEKNMKNRERLEDLEKGCRREKEIIKQCGKDFQDSKPAAALCVLAGLADAETINREILSVGGAAGMSAYMGYYILTARAQAGDMAGALQAARDYWGGMLSLGATTFWEDFDIDWLKNAAPIDRLPREGEVDVHACRGGYCYKGYRNSLCHGWASGPTGWLTESVLGIRILGPGCTELQISPQLGDLDWAEGVYPTSLGDVCIKAWKNGRGETCCEVKSPEGVKVLKQEGKEAAD